VTVDALTFLGRSLFGYGQSADELLGRLDSVDVERAVICPVKPRAYHLAAANDLVADAAARQARFIPLARVDPNLEDDAVLELQRAVGTLGARGLFLHPWEETFRVSDRRLDPLLTRCADLHLPVMIATGYPWLSEAAQVGELARRFPTVPIIMTHGGQINISGLGQADAFAVLQRHAQVHIETSGVYRQDFLEDVATQLGPERILFGSNSPRMDIRLEVQRVRWLTVDEMSRELILAGNARLVFGLGSSAPPASAR
jgi:predicted TIM-barrel fold metal-dependent hydrolase